MTIRPLGPKHWEVDVSKSVNGQQRRKKKRVRCTKAEAESLEARFKRELDAGELTLLRPPTVEDFSAVLLDYARTNNKASEVRSKSDHLRLYILPRFAQHRLDAVTREQVEAFKSDLTTRLKPHTVNNILATLRRLLSLAVEYERLGRVPAFELLPRPPGRIDFLTFDEADAVVAAAEDAWRCRILVGLRTGLRQGELLGLGWSGVELELDQVHVYRAFVKGEWTTPKNGRARRVPLSPAVRAALEAHPRTGELVWPGAAGKPLDYWIAREGLRRACKRAGVRLVGWHVLRHTFASHLVMRGVDIRTVQELMGHSSITQTMAYAHLAPGHRRSAVDVLDGKVE